jgi:hypothetical protein
MAIVLTARDRAVLLVLWKLRFVTLRQLHRAIFRDADRSTATNRLLALQEAGLIAIATKYMHTVSDRDRKVVFITRAGTAEMIASGMLEEDRKNDVPKANQWTLSRPALMHDLQVVDLTTALIKTLDMNFDGWMSDHDLRVNRRKTGCSGIRVPDGTFWFHLPGGEQRMIVLENEYARYSRKAFHVILQRLRWQYPEAFVLIVCAERDHMATMCRWGHYSGIWFDKPDQLMFGHFPDVAAKGARAAWITLAGGIQPNHVLAQGAAYYEGPAEVPVTA